MCSHIYRALFKSNLTNESEIFIKQSHGNEIFYTKTIGTVFKCRARHTFLINSKVSCFSIEMLNHWWFRERDNRENVNNKSEIENRMYKANVWLHAIPIYSTQIFGQRYQLTLAPGWFVWLAAALFFHLIWQLRSTKAIARYVFSGANDDFDNIIVGCSLLCAFGRVYSSHNMIYVMDPHYHGAMWLQIDCDQ